MATNSELATCGVAAWASVEVPRAAVPALRKQPGEFRGGRAPALAVKLGDEQTVLAMAAVLRAINAAGWQDRSFADWGVIAAPQYLARVQTAASLVLIALALTHVTIAAVTIFLHRHQAHRALDLHPVVSHFFRFWLWLTTGMVTKEWAAIHRKHHAKCETAEDPHSPQVLHQECVF